MVRSQAGVPIGGAEVRVDDRVHVVRTTVWGEYWRLLLPGTYTLQVPISSLTPCYTLLDLDLVPII